MASSGAARKRGFTLVELMVVIAIIALLVGILVPAISAVRRSAKVVSTRATLSAMGTGLETYKADSKLGGEYPPSFSDAPPQGGIGWGKVKSPYTNTPMPITGAGLLVWALQGADGLGTPGFFNKAPKQTWSEMSGSAGGNPNDLYYLDPAQGNTPVYPRSGPYIESGKVKVTVDKDVSAATNYAVPNDQSTIMRGYPLYLDTFDQPVLYWRADTVGKQLADQTRNGVSLQQRGIYHWEDNAALVSASASNPEVLNFTGETNGGHGLEWAAPGPFSPTNPPGPGTFQGLIYDPTTQAKLTPRQASSFILLSAGPDGKYGTADDVANFEVGSAK
jgi:prepilin-type N-terminal cleavage/methylation domain-containing protein